jgi:O-antigen biosynthesis protein
MKAKRALLASYGPPEYDRGSGQSRLFHLIEFLIEDGWTVSFLAHEPLRERRYARVLQQRGVAVFENITSKDELFGAGGFDVAIFAFWPVAEALLPAMRAASPGTRVIVDSIDLHFLRNARAVFSRSGPGGYPLLGSRFGSHVIRELNVYAAADAVLTVSQKEADLINDFIADPALAYVVPDCEEVERKPLPLDQRKDIVFIGNFQHKPNVAAVEYLCKEIVPKLDPALLERHHLRILGAGLGDDVGAFGQGLANVHMIGWVPSVWPYLESARISVAPLSYGAGTKRKVLQSLFAGTPLVSTSIGVEGLDLRHEQDVLVADDAQTFAASIQRLLCDDALWRQLASHGPEHVRKNHGRATASTRFRDVLGFVLSRDPKPAMSGSESTQKVFSVAEYRALVRRLQERVDRIVPNRATVMVASKGDQALVQLNGRQAWHLPQNSEGFYAGHHPVSSADVIENVQRLLSKGAEYLVLPETAFWWLDHYEGLRKFLETTHERIWDDDDCIIYRARVLKQG